MNCSAELYVPARANLGEGPVWDSQTLTLYWLDITAGMIHARLPEGKLVAWRVGNAVGAIALRSGGGLIVARQNGFAFLDTTSGLVRPLVDPEEDLVGNRFNDGKCDPAGRFWAGTMSLTSEAAAGSLYRYDAAGQVSKMLGEVTCSNGLAWSADGTTMYYIDTPTRQVDAFDFDNATGKITRRRTVIEIPAADGVPDGMTIDQAGILWIAMWGGWQVAAWNPQTGKKEASIRVPVERVTSCTFGGAALDELFITTARVGMPPAEEEAQPDAGGIFRARPGSRGTPTIPFADA